MLSWLQDRIAQLPGDAPADPLCYCNHAYTQDQVEELIDNPAQLYDWLQRDLVICAVHGPVVYTWDLRTYRAGL